MEAEAGSDRGVDLGDRFSRYCVLNGDGEVMEEGQVRTSEAGFRRHWEGESRQRMVPETGTHLPWISRLLQGFGHQVIVANARKLRAISQNESKNDRQDAEMLARLGYCDPKLLAPIRHRSAERQRDLNLLRARDTLVRARTMLINTTRGWSRAQPDVCRQRRRIILWRAWRRRCRPGWRRQRNGLQSSAA